MTDGWYSADELLLLARAVKAAPDGDIIEIGVYRGRSARVLDAHRAGRDLFLLDDLSMKGADPAYWPSGEDIFHLTGERSSNVVFGDSIALLHHDAAHDYDTVLRDLKWYLPGLLPGGLVALHDYWSMSYPGVQQAWNDYVRESGTNWDDFGRSATLQVWRKCEASRERTVLPPLRPPHPAHRPRRPPHLSGMFQWMKTANSY